MKKIKSRNKTLTQKELVNHLLAKGFDNVNIRLVSEWRSKELLPGFDEIGSGCGKGRGKKENTWRNARLIIRQAQWILRLRKLYPTYNELYFPLWVLGCSIPNERVREFLSEPLDFMVEDLEELITKSRPKLEDVNSPYNYIEDIIDDAVYDSPVLNGLCSLSESPIPPEAIGAGMNVFFNPQYRLDDLCFQEGVQYYQEWREQTQQTQSEIGVSEINESLPLINKDNSFDFIFKYAPFLKENLSLHQLQDIMAKCSDEDLSEVQDDLRAMTKIANGFGEAVLILMQHVREDLKPQNSDEFLPQLFSLAKLVAWTSISLRQKGYGGFINHLRREIPRQIRQDFTKENRQCLAEISPQFAAGLEESLTKIEESLKNMGLTK